MKKEDNQNVDILATLLNDSAGGSPVELDELNELTYRKQPPYHVITEQGERDGPSHENETAPKQKRKFSYSISRNRVSEHGPTKVKVKILIPEEIKHQVSMSRIVDDAIESFLEEVKSEVGE